MHNRQIYVTYIANSISFGQFEDEMREICGFTRGHPFTVKWVDEEGDPCTISSQCEVDEAIRLYEANKEAELTVHGKTQQLYVLKLEKRQNGNLS